MPPLADPAASAPRRSATLERRLPIAIAILLIVTVAVFGVLAFGEVRSASVSAATGQLRTVTTQVVQSLARSAAQRKEATLRLARDPRIVAAAQSPDGNLKAARDMLLRRRESADSLSLVSQWMVDRRGRRHQLLPAPEADSVTITPTPAQGDPRWVDDKAVVALDSALLASRRTNRPSISAFYAVDNEVRFWIVAPIASGRTPLGALVEERRIRGAQSADQQLRAITGQDFRLYLTDRAGALWFGATGAIEPARFDVRTVADSFRVERDDGETLFGRRADIAETPWRAIVVASSSSVFARSTAFLQRMMVTAFVLLLIAGLGAWWVSRQFTRPLHSLAQAAQAIAAGDFSRREPASRDDELGMLATAFNRMASRVGDSHRQLESRIAESEQLRTALEQRNAELVTAQQEATDARIASDAARAEAQRASAAKSDFLAMMSHELRTPLSAIAGYAEILQLGIRGPLSDAARNDVARIQANQAHLLRIINDILDLAQVEAGALVVTLRSVPLAQTLRDLDAIVRPLIDEKRLRFQVTDHAMALHVMADAERLTQVLVNLVANAVRFTDAGGLVRICAAALEDRVAISVVDSGIGIPVDQQAAVFELFVQVDAGPSRRTQGTGLGLTISRRLVEAMGGNLSLTSEPGVGTTFVVDLPAAQDPAVERSVAVDAVEQGGNPQ